ncbi:MAG: methylenetetrahydrofolate--tRNA-(uracil(54)-C(5))-methyltransferase (FADH(2)-oxidizing) TrmFO, partial [Clostridia bacterium]|nr:methylenetetrahydrofolate--tRNA-(uracil(54)-C(5))-methyltransferase (FADH(2)-oxidizing) TrmFO [Clostridia bacterium]
HPLVEVVRGEVTQVPDGPVIIASGPLTSDALAASIAALPGLDTLNFYDAAAPIVTLESINMDRVFRQSRYDRGDDYLNCPMTEEEYNAFVDALLEAETAEIHGFEETKVFEGCMPVESMARRGRMVLAFGPMKPVGLRDPRTGKEAFAVVQLRQDNAAGTLYNLVGFQTRLKFPEQKRVFGMIPGLENASFARFGVMHRNTFLQSPGFLNSHFEMISRPQTYFAGQMTGVEGYVESAASGLLCGLSLGRDLRGLGTVEFPGITAMGAMGRYVSSPNKNFQPMNCSFGLIDGLVVDKQHKKIRNKQQRYTVIAERSLDYMRVWAAENGF